MLRGDHDELLVPREEKTRDRLDRRAKLFNLPIAEESALRHRLDRVNVPNETERLQGGDELRLLHDELRRRRIVTEAHRSRGELDGLRSTGDEVEIAVLAEVVSKPIELALEFLRLHRDFIGVLLLDAGNPAFDHLVDPVEPALEPADLGDRARNFFGGANGETTGLGAGSGLVILGHFWPPFPPEAGEYC